MKTPLNLHFAAALAALCLTIPGVAQENLAPIVNQQDGENLAPIVDESASLLNERSAPKPMFPTPAPPILAIEDAQRSSSAAPAMVLPELDLELRNAVQPVGFRKKNKSNCADGGCAVSCDSCGAIGDCASCGECVACCPCGTWMHRGFAFGEFLMLRPRSAEVVYGVQVNSATAPPQTPVQIGALGVVDPDFEPAFRAGFGMVIDCTRSATLSYTQFESRTASTITRVNPLLNPNSVIQGIVLHPATINAASTGVVASANYGIDFDFIDADYRELFSYGANHQYAFVLGARYAKLDQAFAMTVGTNNAAFLSEQINFDGVGARFGLEGERYTSGRRFFLYGKTMGNLIAGEFSAFHNQGSNADPSIVNTSWSAGRIVPILETEFGVGMQNHNGNLRFSAGYLYQAWFNTPVIDEWAAAVQTNNFRDLDDGMSFDGLTARLEFRF